MTNHTFKIMAQQTRQYQGFPYVNQTYTDAPSIPPPPITEQPGSSADTQQPPVETASPEPSRDPDNRPSRPRNHDLKQVEMPVTKALSQAERELRQRYRPSNVESVQSTYIDETIFYDPFENRRIPNPKESPDSAPKSKINATETFDIDSDYSDTEISTFGEPGIGLGSHKPNQSNGSGVHTMSQGNYGSASTTNIASTHGSYPISPNAGSNNVSSGTSSISALPNSGLSSDSYMSNLGSLSYMSQTAEPSTSIAVNAGSSYIQQSNAVNQGYSTNTSDSYYTKETSVYANTPAEQLPTPIPMDQFPEPPPAYSEFDIPNAVTVAPAPTVQQVPARTEVIITPTPQVTQEPTVLFHPSRKYVVCQYCHQSVLTIVKKEAGFTTHLLAILVCLVGCFPLAIFVYCTDYFKENSHYCPNCDMFLHKDLPITRRGMVLRREHPGA